MLLSELATKSPRVRVLTYGDSGVGKTCLGATFPGPIKLLDFDGKANSIISFLGKGHPKLKDIDVEDLRPTMAGNPIEAFQVILGDLIKQQQAGKIEFETLIIDSLTTFSDAALKHIVKSNPAIKRPTYKQGAQPCQADYGILRREFKRLIPGILSLDCNVLCLGHIKMEKDDTTGAIVNNVMLDGSFGQELPIYFEEVYVAMKKGDRRYLMTQNDGRYKCRTQRGLPKEIDMSYDAIIKEYK